MTEQMAVGTLVPQASQAETFKHCACCGRAWWNREDFLVDSDVKLVGYQADFSALIAGLFLFNHDPCKTTLAVRVERFQELYAGPIFGQRRTGQGDCPGYCLYCLYKSELRPCPAQCECAWVRDLLQMIGSWRGERRGSDMVGGNP